MSRHSYGPSIGDRHDEEECRGCGQPFTSSSPGKRCRHCGYRYCRHCSKFQATPPTSVILDLITDYQAMLLCRLCVDILDAAETRPAHLVSDGFPTKLVGPPRYLRQVTAGRDALDEDTRPSADMSQALVPAGAWELGSTPSRDNLRSTRRRHSRKPHHDTVPTLEELLVMTPTSIEALSPTTLKLILDIHGELSDDDAVHGAPKETLVRLVLLLQDIERSDRERQFERGVGNLRLMEPPEPEYRAEGGRHGHTRRPEYGRRRMGEWIDDVESVRDVSRGFGDRHEREGPSDTGHDATFGAPRTAETSSRSKAPGRSKNAAAPRSKDHASASDSPLCVVCQDEEANMAVITCGHVALCKGCSETIMGSTRRCPLCRTNITSRKQIIRIYKP
ncbi:hypothetical protein GALMADRAFT_242403 [Galerina marginata CBS 339.88]|uniref:RING-type domain-containing protein n=1 Tax=Galerina marginata (strain CBS 339.88) TaxID=685588 RepID=A0A067TAA9_GALM3|nr:hypothetical protein GALMADRAFT_242403 [Galerina marginata CBS 339.88]